MTRALIAAAAIALAGPAAAGAQVALTPTEPTVYAGPNAVTFGYLNEEVEIEQGGSLGIASFDFVGHTVTSTIFDEDGFPIFGADETGFNERSDVGGVDLLAPGTYSFICIFHSNLRGTLTVTAPTTNHTTRGGVR